MCQRFNMDSGWKKIDKEISQNGNNNNTKELIVSVDLQFFLTKSTDYGGIFLTDLL